MAFFSTDNLEEPLKRIAFRISTDYSNGAIAMQLKVTEAAGLLDFPPVDERKL